MASDDLKLMALDGDDLKVISACVQDAVMQASEIAFDAQLRQMILPIRRFTWEKEKTERTRKNAVLRITRIKSMKSKGINNNGGNQVLSILAIDAADLGDGHAISVLFAGEAQMLITVSAIELELRDLGGAWSAVRQPDHRV